MALNFIELGTWGPEMIPTLNDIIRQLDARLLSAEENLEENSVASSNLQTGSVGSGAIAVDSVESQHIVNDTILGEDLNPILRASINLETMISFGNEVIVVPAGGGMEFPTANATGGGTASEAWHTMNMDKDVAYRATIQFTLAVAGGLSCGLYNHTDAEFIIPETSTVTLGNNEFTIANYSPPTTGDKIIVASYKRSGAGVPTIRGMKARLKVNV